MGQLQRVQLLIDEEQRQELTRISERQGRSVSDVVREMIREGLERRSNQKAQGRQALEGLRQIRESNAYLGPYLGDPVGEAREERNQQLEAIWQEWFSTPTSESR